jgi:hypothetical protein
LLEGAAQNRIARYQQRKAQLSTGRAEELADAQDKIYESLDD